MHTPSGLRVVADILCKVFQTRQAKQGWGMFVPGKDARRFLYRGAAAENQFCFSDTSDETCQRKGSCIVNLRPGMRPAGKFS